MSLDVISETVEWRSYLFSSLDIEAIFHELPSSIATLRQ
jgi:hypothetical protein